MAVSGSRCSSAGSTTTSRERCMDRASDSLSPVARDVDTPHAVLAAMPAVSEADSLVPHVEPACVEVDPPPTPASANPRSVAWDRPLPLELDSLSEVDTAAEAESPTVLVYDPPAVSVTDVPI